MGSEMCIRDSGEGPPRLGGKPAGDIHYRFLIDMPTELTEEQSELCLLYTSDAADDLLCVDLGGRRINKKKTQSTIPHIL